MKWFLVICYGLILTGCYKEQPSDESDRDLVLTNYQLDFPFAAQNTYALPDSAVVVNASNYNGVQVYVAPANNAALINAISSNMNKRGWVRVSVQNNPDVIIFPTVSSSSTIFYDYTSQYWNWWIPSVAWQWNYPEYFYAIKETATVYKRGSVFIQMVAPQMAHNNQVPVVWTCTVNGLTEGEQSEIPNRIAAAVQQAFNQTPVLTKP